MPGKSSRTRPSLANPETLCKIFIGICAEEGAERLAYVSRYDADTKKHLVTYMGKEPEDAIIELNESNCINLTNEAVRKMIYPQGLKQTLKEEAKRLKLKAPVKRLPKKRKSKRLEKKAMGVIEDTELTRNLGIVGTCILIRLESRQPRLYALIVGFQAPSTHKLYFFSGENYETFNLKDFEWLQVPPTMTPWDSKSLVGCRIYISFPADRFKDLDCFEKKKSAASRAPKPYEAYVVAHDADMDYKIFITFADLLQSINLEEANWDVISQSTQKVDGTPIIMWK